MNQLTLLVSDSGIFASVDWVNLQMQHQWLQPAQAAAPLGGTALADCASGRVDSLGAATVLPFLPLAAHQNSTQDLRCSVRPSVAAMQGVLADLCDQQIQHCPA
eukprot:CAMPEP_0172700248 /NCGR_PEP_ID=MMETSP1074-20121228/30775_1 /TAXON_ID=2916 /ORGANISM="Ceratium fusus, Strain PA161109" /LENGTH=103 /DNA_ID=CAMNT_0013521597 /DNA_START=215 /DNA_END=527 /DNA_ORIENTATION=-